MKLCIKCNHLLDYHYSESGKNNYKCSLTIRKKPYVGDKINIIWMNKKADNGLPHTRYPNIICLPENIKEEDIEFIILHETVHITQRLYTNEWNYILEKWNMKPWKGVLPTEINNRIRINPDTINEPLYIWKKRWIGLSSIGSRLNKIFQERMLLPLGIGCSIALLPLLTWV